MSKVIRIDLQGVCSDTIFPSKEQLRKYLIDFHTQDDGWVDYEDSPEDLATYTLDKICSMFEWRYEEVDK
tara:strand:- start:1679 stop:1888 length:210 start_codon:yes stop_codon:yes gene_type:complete